MCNAVVTEGHLQGSKHKRNLAYYHPDGGLSGRIESMAQAGNAAGWTDAVGWTEHSDFPDGWERPEAWAGECRADTVGSWGHDGYEAIRKGKGEGMGPPQPPSQAPAPAAPDWRVKPSVPSYTRGMPVDGLWEGEWYEGEVVEILAATNEIRVGYPDGSYTDLPPLDCRPRQASHQSYQ